METWAWWVIGIVIVLILVGVGVYLFIRSRTHSGTGQGIPAPTGLAVSVSSDQQTITANWNSVANASSYSWTIFQNSSIITTGTTAGTTVSSAAPTPGAYTFSVVAVVGGVRGAAATTSFSIAAPSITVDNVAVCQPTASSLRVTATLSSAASNVAMSVSNGTSHPADSVTLLGPLTQQIFVGTFTTLPTNFLVDGNSYTITVTGDNVQTSSTTYIASQANACPTPPSIPPPPTDVTVTENLDVDGPTTYAASWTASPGATSYSWTITAGGVVVTQGTQAGTSIAALPISTCNNYNFNVHAQNVAGTSAAATATNFC